MEDSELRTGEMQRVPKPEHQVNESKASMSDEWHAAKTAKSTGLFHPIL